jgi:putative methionine-R-sulfoxide reductase with GAF domain
VCDPRARSEIVVPVIGRGESLIGVFDVDASYPGAFGAADAEGLDLVLTWFKQVDGEGNDG